MREPDFKTPKTLRSIEDREGLGPGMRFVSIQSICRWLGMERVDVICLVQQLELPVMRFKSQVDPQVDPLSRHWEIKEYVLSVGFEMAILGCMMPGGTGFLAEDIAEEFDSLPDIIDHGHHVFHVTSYWKKFLQDPYRLQELMAVSSMIYGDQDDKELRKRLALLGKQLIREAKDTRGARVRAHHKQHRRYKRLAEITPSGGGGPPGDIERGTEHPGGVLRSVHRGPGVPKDGVHPTPGVADLGGHLQRRREADGADFSLEDAEGDPQGSPAEGGDRDGSDCLSN